ncbi:MAG: hypothetical protein RI891_759, partial [Gemmatimonadota bacterium]
MTAASASFRVALVGCGRISANHVQALAKVEGLDLVAVCDVDAGRAEATGRAAGVPWFTDYPRMLAEVDCEVVIVAT